MAKFLKLSLGRRAEPDDDLDFPDFDFDNPSVSDDRSPVIKAALATKQGFTDKLKDGSVLRDKLRENLPSEFGEAADFASTGIGETKDFIKKSVKDLKPAAANISKSIKAFLPANFTRITAKLDAIEEWANSERRQQGPSIEQQREQDIGINIGRIFEQQALRDETNEAKDDAKENFDQAIEFGRHKNQISVLNAINKAVTATGNYTTKINSEFQRKSLELQYRLLFATRDILETSKKSYEDSKTLLTGISKNTALPEYVKLRNSERFMEQSRNKFMNHSLDTVTGYGKRMMDRVKGEVTNTVGMVNDMAGMASMGTDMLKMVEELEGKKTLGEKGGKAGGGFLAGKLLDFMIGKGGAKLKEDPQRLDKFAKVTNKLGYLLGNKDRLLKDTEEFDEEDPNYLKRQVGKFTRNFSGSKAIDLSMKRTGVDEMGAPSVFTNLVSKSITDIIPGYLAKILKEVSTSNLAQEKISTPKNRAGKRSAPAPVAKKQADAVIFDHKTGRFTKEKALIRLHRMKFERGNKAVEDKLEPILSHIESINELNEEERAKVSKFLMDYSLNGYSFSIEKFSKPQTFDRRLPPELGAKISNSFAAIKEKLDPESAEYHRQQRKMSAAFNDIGRNMGSSAKDAQDLVTFGQEHVAKQAGMIKKGNYNLNGQKDNIARHIKAPTPLEERTEEQIKADNARDTDPVDWDAQERQRALARGSTFETKPDGTIIETKRDGSTIETKPDGTKIKRDQFGTEIASDVMAKEDIRLTKKNSFLGKLKKLKMFDWKYKKNHEADDGGVPHVGPMAQNVNDVVGSKAAPGGTKIDMVNMNGFLTGAVQELSGKVDDIETKRDQGAVPPPVAPVVNRLAPDYVTTLTEQIRDNTKRIADGTFLSLSMLGKFDLSKMDFSNFNITEALKSAKDSVKAKAKSAARWGYDYVQDGSIKSGLHGIANAGLGAAQSVVSLGGSVGSLAKKMGQRGFTGVKDAGNWLWENPIKGAGNYISGKRDAIINTVDVFVKPDETPRMTYNKIKRGDYVQIDEPDKPLITKDSISAASSDIVDTKTGLTVIYRAELSEMHFKFSGKNKLVSAVKKVGEKLNDGRKRFQAFIPVAYTFAWDMSKKLYKTVLNWVEGPTDVYVKGERVPRLFKHAMIKGAYIRASDSKVIERPSQIDGMVYDVNQQVVISFEDFQLGLVNSKGEPFTGPVKKIMSSGKKLLSTLNRKLKSGGKRVLSTLSKIGKTAVNIAAHGVVGASNTLGGITGAFNSEGIDLLKSIRDILDARLPGGKGIGYGNVSHDDAGNEIVGPKNENAPQAKSGGLSQTVRQYTGEGNVLDRLKTDAGKTKTWGKKLWSRVKTRKEEVVSDITGSESAEKIKELKDQTKEQLARLKKEATAAALKNKKDTVVDKLRGLREKAAGRIGSWQSMKDRVNVNKADHSKELDAVRKYEIKNTFTLIADMIKGVKDKVAGFFGMGDDKEGGMPDFDLGDDEDPRRRRSRRRGQVRRGRMARGARRSLARVRNMGGRISGSIAGNAPGALRVGGQLLGGLGRGTGALLKGTAGLAGRALMGSGGMLLRGGIMAAGALPGMASAAMGAASAVAGAISLPVVAGVVVAGALIYGGYKLYQHLTRKKWNDVETFRMLEYGLRGGDTDAFKKIYTLEKMLTDASSVTETEVSLDNKKVDAASIYKVFGVEPNPQSQEDQDRLHAFNTWYERRFTPIFHKWLKASYKAYGKAGLDELESSDVDRHYQVLKAVSEDNVGWDVTFSPFNLSNLNTDTEVIGGFRKALMTRLSKEAKPEDETKKTKAMAAEAAAAGLGVKALSEDGAAQDAKAKADTGTSLASKAFSAIKTAFGYTPVALLATGIGKASGWFTEKATVGMKFVINGHKDLFNNVFGKSVSALEAVKMRAYGMGTLDKSKVNNLRKLEELLSVHTKFNSDGTLSWDGDLEVLAGGARKLFGIAADDVAQNKALLDYVTGRFLPIYLMYYNGINALHGKSDISMLKAVEGLVKGSDAVEIANRMIGSSDLWAKQSSPWKDYDLSTDATSARDNVAYLLDQAKKEELPEEKKLQSKTSESASKGSPANASSVPEKSTSSVTGFFKNLFKPSAPEGHPEAETKEVSGPSGGGQPAAAPTTGASAGKLVMAGGELATGSGASKFMKLKGAVNLTNMNPDFMKLFNGMVEEYGQKSGKSIQVNSAWRSTAAQAELYRTLPKGQAARPGNSLHEFGLAMDVSSADLDAMDKVGLLRKYGFTRPIAKEPWHIEPVGLNSPQLLASAKTNPEVARTAIEASIGRGGGGVGDTQRGAKSYFRDWKVHNQIFNSNVPPTKEEQDTLLASLPATGYAAGVDKLKGSQGAGSAPSGAPSGAPANTSSSVGAGAGAGNLAAAPEGEGSKNGPALGVAQASGIVKPEAGFAANATHLAAVQDSGNSGGKLWKDLPNSNGASWQAQGPMIQEAAKMVGLDPALAAAIAAKESGFNPTSMSKEAGPKAARGMYQFKPDTFNEMVKKYGSKYGIDAQSANIMDPRQSALMGMHYVKQGMSSAGGTSPGWAYLTHFLGQGGNLNKFKSMGDGDIAANTLPGPASQNPPVFYHGGKKDSPRTKGEIIAFADSELQRKLTEFKVPLALNGAGGARPFSEQATAVAKATDAPVPSTQGPAPASSKSESVQMASSPGALETTQVAYKPGLSSKPAVDTSNPAYQPAAEPVAKKPATGFGIFNTPTNEQVAAANQPMQKGSDPSRDFKGLGETNEILSKQLTVLGDIKGLAAQIVAGILGMNRESSTAQAVNVNAQKPKEPSSVRQNHIPTTQMSAAMVSRARTIV